MTPPEITQPNRSPGSSGAEPGEAGRESSAGTLAFAVRVLIATGIVVTVTAVLLLLLYAADLLLLLFAGVLVSIPLRRLGGALQRATGLAAGLALGLVVVALTVFIVSIGAVAAGRIASHGNELMNQLRLAVESLGTRLEGYAWAQEAISRLPSLGEVLLGGGGVLSRLTGLASTTLGAVINIAVVIVVGIYFASQPDVYSGGIKHLAPVSYRRRVDEVLTVLDEALGRWLLGRLGLMVINGALTALALWLLGVPLAVTLGVIAGLLNFVPNFGPFIAAVPAVLIAMLGGTQLAVYTALVYVIVQMVDAYVLTPLIDRKSVELPPALTISAQLLLGVLFGFVGLLVASPLTATVLILVKMLYVEDVLGDPIMRASVLGEQAAGAPDSRTDRVTNTETAHR